MKYELQPPPEVFQELEKDLFNDLQTALFSAVSFYCPIISAAQLNNLYIRNQFYAHRISALHNPFISLTISIHMFHVEHFMFFVILPSSEP